MTGRHRLLLAMPALVLTALVAVVAFAASSGDSDRLTHAQLTAYEHAITPIVKDGGATVQEGLKPAITDLVVQHIVPPAIVAREADQWAVSLGQDRSSLAKVKAPSQLREAHRAFLAALDKYIASARALAVAARTSSSGRGAAMQAVYAAGNAGDQTYDQASALLQQSRHALGLAPNLDFPTGG